MTLIYLLLLITTTAHAVPAPVAEGGQVARENLLSGLLCSVLDPVLDLAQGVLSIIHVSLPRPVCDGDDAGRPGPASKTCKQLVVDVATCNRYEEAVKCTQPTILSKTYLVCPSAFPKIYVMPTGYIYDECYCDPATGLWVFTSDGVPEDGPGPDDNHVACSK